MKGGPRGYCLLAATLLILGSAAACRRAEEPQPAVAIAKVALNHNRVALGSPVEISYQFDVAKDAPRFAENYRVFVHFVDTDGELMWTDDHDPAVPTTQWAPGQQIRYARTVFIPVYPYLGQATIEAGLHSPTSDERLVLAGEDRGQRSYRVASLELLPQTENIFVAFKDGWHDAEAAPNNAAVEWQWTRKEATVSVRNPKRDVLFYLHLDSPGGIFEEPQQVDVTLGGQSIDSFVVKPREELIRKVPLTAAQLGSAEMLELKIVVDKTFIPAAIAGGKSRDPRELGVRVFHIFVEPRDAVSSPPSN